MRHLAPRNAMWRNIVQIFISHFDPQKMLRHLALLGAKWRISYKLCFSKVDHLLNRINELVGIKLILETF